MKNEDLNSFLCGTLDSKKVVEKPYHHVTRYFKFSSKGKRTVNQVKSFLLGLEVPLRYVSNINLISDEILELSYFKAYKDIIESKVTRHLELLVNYDLDLLFNKNANKNDLMNIFPVDSSEIHTLNEVTIKRLETLNIKLGFRKYLRRINNKIKEIMAKEFINEPIICAEQAIIGDKMDVENNRKRFLEEDNADLVDEFALKNPHVVVSNDQ